MTSMNMNVNVTIDQDTDIFSPRDWDNYGTMVCGHGRYLLGDEQIRKGDFSSWDEVEDYLRKERGAEVVLPLYLFDHSIISMSTRPFNGPYAQWDSGQVGFIFATRESIEKMQGWKVLTAERRQKVEEYLRAEVDTYDMWLQGDVWYISIEINDEIYDDIGGVYGREHAQEEAANMLANSIRRAFEELKDSGGE